MEPFPQSMPLWEIQKELAQKILRLNQLVTKHDVTGRLSFEEWEELLKLVLELEIVFLPELLAMESIKDLLGMLHAYKANKDDFIAKYPHEVLATYFNDRTKKVQFTVYQSYKIFKEDKARQEEKDYKVKWALLIPRRENLLALARAIILAGMELEILRFAKKPVPRQLFDWRGLNELQKTG